MQRLSQWFFAAMLLLLVVSNGLALGSMWLKSEDGFWKFFAASNEGQAAEAARVGLDKAFKGLEDAARENPQGGVNAQLQDVGRALSSYRETVADNLQWKRSCADLTLAVGFILVLLSAGKATRLIAPSFAAFCERESAGIDLSKLPEAQRTAFAQHWGVVRWHLHEVAQLLKSLPTSFLNADSPAKQAVSSLQELARFFAASGIPSLRPENSAYTQLGKERQALADAREALDEQNRRFVQEREQRVREGIELALARDSQGAAELRRSIARLKDELEALQRRKAGMAAEVCAAESMVAGVEEALRVLDERERELQVREAGVLTQLQGVERALRLNEGLVLRIDAGCSFLAAALVDYLAEHPSVAATVLSRLTTAAASPETGAER